MEESSRSATGAYVRWRSDLHRRGARDFAARQVAARKALTEQQARELSPIIAQEAD